jgi:chromosome segregation ATPase
MEQIKKLNWTSTSNNMTTEFLLEKLATAENLLEQQTSESETIKSNLSDLQSDIETAQSQMEDITSNYIYEDIETIETRNSEIVDNLETIKKELDLIGESGNEKSEEVLMNEEIVDFANGLIELLDKSPRLKEFIVKS